MATNEESVLSQYVPGFRANLNLSPQQTETKLLSAVDGELSYDTPGQMFNADDVGVSDPEDVLSRVPDTPDKFLAMSRRVGIFVPFHDSAWIDNVDKARELTDPTNKTMMALMAGRWRKVDTTIINRALGTAWSKADDTGTLTQNALPASQIIPANDVSMAHDGEIVPTNASDYGLSVGKVIRAGMLLDDSELEGERHLPLGPQQMADLLRRTPATSTYYADVKALVSGQLTQFLGFTIHRLPRKRFPFVLGHDGVSAVRKIPAWIKPAVVYKGRPITDARIAIRRDKSDTPQAFYKTEHDAVRRYDEAVVEIDCYEGPAY